MVDTTRTPMSITTNKYTLAVLAILALFVGVGATAAPAAACVCSDLSFGTPSSATGTPGPIILTMTTTTFTTGNTMQYSDFGTSTAQYMYIFVTGVTAGWTVTVTSSSPTTATLSNGIIVGPFTNSGTISYTIKERLLLLREHLVNSLSTQSHPRRPPHTQRPTALKTAAQ